MIKDAKELYESLKKNLLIKKDVDQDLLKWFARRTVERDKIRRMMPQEH